MSTNGHTVMYNEVVVNSFSCCFGCLAVGGNGQCIFGKMICYDQDVGKSTFGRHFWRQM